MSTENTIKGLYTQNIMSQSNMCAEYRVASRALREKSKYESRNWNDEPNKSIAHFVDVLRYFGGLCCQIPEFHEFSTLKIVSYTSGLMSGDGQNKDFVNYLSDLTWLDVADKIEDTITRNLRAQSSQLRDHRPQLPIWHAVISNEEMEHMRKIRNCIAVEFDPRGKEFLLSLKGSLISPDSFAGRLSYLMAVIEAGEIVPLLRSAGKHYRANTILLLKDSRDFFSKLSLRSVCELSQTISEETIQEASEELRSLLEAVLPDKSVIDINGAMRLQNVVDNLKKMEKKRFPDDTAKAEDEANTILESLFPWPDGYEESQDYAKRYYSMVKKVKSNGPRRSSHSTECTNLRQQERYNKEYVVDNAISQSATKKTNSKIDRGISKEIHLKVLETVAKTQEIHDSHMKVKELHEHARQLRDKFHKPLSRVLSGNSSDDAKKKLERFKAPPDTNPQTKNDNEVGASSKPDMEKLMRTICHECLNERGPEIQLAMTRLQEMLEVDTNDDGQLCVRSRPNEALAQQEHLYEHIRNVFSSGSSGNVVSASRYLLSAISQNFCDWPVSESRPNLRHLLRCFRNFHFHSHRFYGAPLIAGGYSDRQYNDELELVDHVTICLWELLPILGRNSTL